MMTREEQEERRLKATPFTGSRQNFQNKNIILDY